jgi:hypothetical protein
LNKEEKKSLYLNTYILAKININTNCNTSNKMHSELTLLTKSKSKADEIILLINDLKPVVRQALYKYEIPALQVFCKKHNLYITTSRFKVILKEDVGTFSNLGLRIPLTDKRDGVIHVYLSKDEAKAHLAHYFELMQNDESLGELLGYPGCCIAYFSSNFSKDTPNPIQNQSDPLLNLTKREQDAVLISHFPCSQNCEKSKIIAKRNITYLEKYYPGRAYELKQTLDLI